MAVTSGIHVDPMIADRYPGYVALAIFAGGVDQAHGSGFAEEFLQASERSARQHFAGMAPAAHTHILAWRQAYSSFGAKPSKYPCSAEALLKRVVSGDSVSSGNALVDLYNAVSIRHVVPAGGEDLGAIRGTPTLTFALGGEPFTTSSDADAIAHPAKPGEVVWRDLQGVTCRRWSWRQCQRTRLTGSTSDAYFLLERLPPYPLDDLLAAGDDLISGLLRMAPDASVQRRLVGSG